MGDQPPTPGQEVTCGARGEAEIPMTGPFPKALFVPWATPPVHSPVEGIAVFWDDGATHVGLNECPTGWPYGEYLPGGTASEFTEPWPFPPPDYVLKAICKTISGSIEPCSGVVPNSPFDFVGVVDGNYKLVRVEIMDMDDTKVSCRVVSVEDKGPTGGVSGGCLNFTPKIKMCEVYVLED